MVETAVDHVPEQVVIWDDHDLRVGYHHGHIVAVVPGAETVTIPPTLQNNATKTFKRTSDTDHNGLPIFRPVTP